MKIISKFHDYYDSVQIYGQDKSQLYIRDQEELLLDRDDIEYLKLVNIRRIRLYNSDYFIYIIPIIFCGKLYYCIKMLIYKSKSNSWIERYFYKLEDLNDFIESNEEFDEYKLNENKYWSINFKLFLNNNETLRTDICVKYKTPIIVINNYKNYNDRSHENKNTMIINAKLNDYEFYKCKDSFAAFQEIMMFNSNILTNPEKTIPIISDELKIQSKGFDKWSFRKYPKEERK